VPTCRTADGTNVKCPARDGFRSLDATPLFLPSLTPWETGQVKVDTDACGEAMKGLKKLGICFNGFVRLVAVLVVLLLGGKVLALDITTLSGKTYKNCQILAVEADRLRIMHSTGVTSIEFDDLPEPIRKRYHYDPGKAAEVKTKRLEKDSIAAEAKAKVAEEANLTAAQQQAAVRKTEQEKQRATQLKSVPTSASSPPEQPVAKKPILEAQRSPPVSQSPNQRRIALSSLWDSKVQGGSETMRDLQRLFAPHATASAELNSGSDLMLADGIPYLCSLQVVQKRLNVDYKISTKNLIACPGFPRDSIYYHSYDGHFEDRYNRMYIVVDAADQVLGLELVDESLKRDVQMQWDRNWFCYDFVNYRVKAAPRLMIAHEFKEIRHDVFQVDSGLYDPGMKGGRARLTHHTLEISRWYVPRPFVQLILYCISRQARDKILPSLTPQALQ
jgi:hypothetical protein